MKKIETIDEKMKKIKQSSNFFGVLSVVYFVNMFVCSGFCLTYFKNELYSFSLFWRLCAFACGVFSILCLIFVLAFAMKHNFLRIEKTLQNTYIVKKKSKKVLE